MVVITIVTQNNGETLHFDEPFEKANLMKLHSCSLYNSWKNRSTWGTVRAVPDRAKQYNLLSVPSGHHTHETLVDYFNQDKNKAESAAFTINGGIYFVSKLIKSSSSTGLLAFSLLLLPLTKKLGFSAALKQILHLLQSD